MAKLPKYICFKVTSKNNGAGYSLKKVNPYELEETAHWKKCVEDGLYWFECSNCGKEPLYTRYKQEILSHYCPYCGALMLEEEDDKEVLR